MATEGVEAVQAVDHRPVPVHARAHCRVDCTCGWRGPVVPMFGQGHTPWAEHFKTATPTGEDSR